ncbi:MAG: hypothetical protein ACI8ZB_003623 [Desulforhopalus sp.]|jgi:hypothetical protein
MERNSLTREFNPKRRLYAPQEYQAYRPKTPEKAIFALESLQSKRGSRLTIESSIIF